MSTVAANPPYIPPPFSPAPQPMSRAPSLLSGLSPAEAAHLPASLVPPPASRPDVIPEAPLIALSQSSPSSPSLPPPSLPSLPPPSLPPPESRPPSRAVSRVGDASQGRDGHGERRDVTARGSEDESVYECIDGPPSSYEYVSASQYVRSDLATRGVDSGYFGSIDSFSCYHSEMPAARPLPAARGQFDTAPPLPAARAEKKAPAALPRTHDEPFYVNLAAAQDSDAGAKVDGLVLSDILDRQGAPGCPNDKEYATLLARSLLVRDDTITNLLIDRGVACDGLTEREAHYLLGRLTCEDTLSEQGRTLIVRLKDLTFHRAALRLARTCDALLDKAAEVARTTRDAELIKALYQADALKDVKVVTLDRATARTASKAPLTAEQAGVMTRFAAWFVSLFRWLLPSAADK